MSEWPIFFVTVFLTVKYKLQSLDKKKIIVETGKITVKKQETPSVNFKGRPFEIILYETLYEQGS